MLNNNYKSIDGNCNLLPKHWFEYKIQITILDTTKGLHINISNVLKYDYNMEERTTQLLLYIVVNKMSSSCPALYSIYYVPISGESGE